MVTFTDICNNINTAMEELTGEELAELHNQVCAKKIRYEEDSTWEYTGEDDNKETENA